MDRPLDDATKRRRLLRRVSIALAALLLGGGAFLALPKLMRPSVKRSRVRTARVERGTVEATITSSGAVVPGFEKVFSSPVEARVVRIPKKAGALLQQGEEIVELDTSSSQLDHERVKERVEQKLNERSQLRLSLEQQIADLRARREQKELDAEILGYKAEQQKKLLQEGLTSSESARQAVVEASKAQIELRQIAEGVENAKRTTQAKLDGIDMELRVLRNEREVAGSQLELASTRTDRPGVLTWVISQEGATVRKGEVIARVADLSTFRVQGSVSDVHSSRISIGMPVKVRVEEMDLRGTVSAIDPTISNGVIGYTVDLEDPSNARLRNNLRVEIFLVVGRRENTLRVARGPFAGEEMEQRVFVIEGDKAVRKLVRFGAGGFDALEVLQGLEPGDEVIISSMEDYIHLDEVKLKK